MIRQCHVSLFLIFGTILVLLDIFYSEVETPLLPSNRLPQPTLNDNPIDVNSSLLAGMNRFEWYRSMYFKDENTTKLKTASNLSTLYAYEFEHEFTVTVTNFYFLGYRVYCRYLDENGKEIGNAEESLSYPVFVVNCPKRAGTKKIGLSADDVGHFQPLPIVDRMLKEPKYELSMCIATLYGDEPKWLMLIEMIEHYKLQGVQHFYLHIHNVSLYDLKAVNEYVRTGELEVAYLLEQEQQKRNDREWHMVHVADCAVRSRKESRWTIFADLDERILMTKYPGTILDYVRKVKNETVAVLQFRQQWILKTEFMPERYDGDQQLDTWMPTHRWHNSSGIGPPGHTAKCIVDTSKVLAMKIHYPQRFYPDHGYHTKKLDPEEGIVRHYRDQTMWDWGKNWLPGVLRFGPLRMTDYPSKLLGKLTENVKKRANLVYGNAKNE